MAGETSSHIRSAWSQQEPWLARHQVTYGVRGVNTSRGWRDIKSHTECVESTRAVAGETSSHIRSAWSQHEPWLARHQVTYGVRGVNKSRGRRDIKSHTECVESTRAVAGETSSHIRSAWSQHEPWLARHQVTYGVRGVNMSRGWRDIKSHTECVEST